MPLCLNINPHMIWLKKDKGPYAWVPDLMSTQYVFFYYICTAIVLTYTVLKYNTSWYLKACPTDKRKIGLWGYGCLYVIQPLYTSISEYQITETVKMSDTLYIFIVYGEVFRPLNRIIWKLVFEKSKRSATKNFKIFIGVFAFLNRV